MHSELIQDRWCALCTGNAYLLIAPIIRTLQLGARTLNNAHEKCMDAGITDETVLTLKIRATSSDNCNDDNTAEMNADDKEVRD